MFNKSILIKISLALFLIGIIIFPACQDEPGSTEPIYTSQQGIIKDIQGNPVISAEIKALNATNIVIDAATTDDNGSFKLTKIPSDFKSIQLNISHPDFQTFQQSLTQLIQNKVGDNLNVVLAYNDSCCNRVEIEVADSTSGEALSGVEIRMNRGEKVLRKSYTNDNGSLVFENVCDGEYWLRLYKQGYKVIEKEFGIDNCDTVRLSFDMVEQTQENDSCCNGVVYLTIKDSQGNPIQGAYTKIWKKNTDQTRELTTGDDGRVIFRELCAGEYGALYKKDGYVAQDFSFTLECNDTLEFNKTLNAEERDSCCNGVVYLTIKDGEDRAIKGAWARLSKGSTKIKELTTGEDGRVIFKFLCEGDYQISFGKEGYEAQEFNFEVGCDDTLEFNKTLQAKEQDSCCNGRIKIFAKDKSSGEAVQYGTVKIYKNDQSLGYKSLTNGYAVWEGLCEGKYTFKIVSETHQTIDFVVELGCNENKEITKEMERIASQDTCCNGKVYFIVKNNEGQAIQGVLVKLWKGSTIVTKLTTGQDGRVIFENLCEGNYQISFSKDGYQGQEFNFELGCNQTKEFSKVMQSSQQDTCCNGKLILYLKDKNSGEPTNKASVILWKGNQKVGIKYPQDGKVVFEKLCEGEYGVDVGSDYYKSFEFGFSLDCNETEEITKYLEENSVDTCYTAILKLRVLNGEQQPIEGATIKIEYPGGDSQETTTNGEGWGAFDGLTAPMTYKVTITKDGYQTKTLEIPFNECKTIQETIKLIGE